MTNSLRHEKILNILEKQTYITIQNIIDELGISPATARRDIVKLSQQGKLEKLRNGAKKLNAEKQPATSKNIFAENINNFDEKSLIAIEASKLCNKDDVVLINCGTTAFMLGKELCNKEVHIITNYFPIVKYLIDNDHENLTILGGQYSRTNQFFINNNINEYASDLMFTSGKGLTADGLYKTDFIMSASEQQMIKKSNKLVVVIDSSKIGKKVGMLFCKISDIDVLITDKNADETIVKSLIEQNIQVILV